MCGKIGAPVHFLAQLSPGSVGGVLLEHDHLHNLRDADRFDVLRLGLVRTSTVCGNSRRRCCALCGGAEYGLTHILASCVQAWYERENFLHDVER